MRRHHHLSHAGIALLLSTSGACASGAALEESRGAFVTRAWELPAGQSCEVTGPPPTPEAVIDARALVAALEGPPPSGSVLMYVARPQDPATASRPVWRGIAPTLAEGLHILDTDLPEREAERVRAAVAPLVSPGHADYLLRIDLDDGVRVGTWPSVGCPPFMRNREAVSQAVRNVPAPAGSWTVQLEVLVDETGQVIRSHIARSTGSAAVDAEFRRIGEMMRFAPALLNGVPVRVVVAMPLSLRR